MRGERRHLEAARHGEAEQGRDRLAAIERDRRHEEAFEQAIAAAGAALGVDRHAGRAQHLDIAIDGADRDLEALCQRARRHPPAIAQQQQDGEAAFDSVHDRAIVTIDLSKNQPKSRKFSSIPDMTVSVRPI
jgi:hypothetical protein